MRLSIMKSRIIYINETRRKLANKPVPNNNSYTETTTVANQGRQYFTETELQNLLPDASLTKNFGKT